MKKLRIFSKDGVELHQDDYEYISDGDIFYVSKGKDFLTQRNGFTKFKNIAQ